jgi:hypothetical protein
MRTRGGGVSGVTWRRLRIAGASCAAASTALACQISSPHHCGCDPAPHTLPLRAHPPTHLHGLPDQLPALLRLLHARHAERDLIVRGFAVGRHVHVALALRVPHLPGDIEWCASDGA